MCLHSVIQQTFLSEALSWGGVSYIAGKTKLKSKILNVSSHVICFTRVTLKMIPLAIENGIKVGIEQFCFLFVL